MQGHLRRVLSSVVNDKGPFNRKDRTAHFDGLVERDVSLFPSGPPFAKADRAPPHDADIARVTHIAKDIFNRKVAIPNIERRNTVEIFDGYLLGLVAFDFRLPIVGGVNYTIGQVEIRRNPSLMATRKSMSHPPKEG